MGECGVGDTIRKDKKASPYARIGISRLAEKRHSRIGEEHTRDTQTRTRTTQAYTMKTDFTVSRPLLCRSLFTEKKHSRIGEDTVRLMVLLMAYPLPLSELPALVFRVCVCGPVCVCVRVCDCFV